MCLDDSTAVSGVLEAEQLSGVFLAKAYRWNLSDALAAIAFCQVCCSDSIQFVSCDCGHSMYVAFVSCDCGHSMYVAFVRCTCSGSIELSSGRSVAVSGESACSDRI